MHWLAPDILEEARTLSPLITSVGLVVGFLLWSIGGRTHRFWLAMTMTLSAGLLGLVYGKAYGMQPLVAGLLLAVSAGALALSLVRLLMFLGGGVAALVLMQAAAPGWDEPIAFFLVGGLVGVLLYRVWITVFASLAGTLLMTYSAVCLCDRLGLMTSPAWAQKNGPLLDWGCASLTVTGVLVQFLLERRRRRKSQPVAAAAPAEPPPAEHHEKPAEKGPPPPGSLWAWGHKLIHRRAG